jgi:4-oxalocrotonate tautomerase
MARSRGLGDVYKRQTDACVKTLASKPDSVDVLFFDVPRQNWATGGVPWSEKS